MPKSFFICTLFWFAMTFKGSSQSPIQQNSSQYVYHHPSEDKLSWQRLNLWLSCIFFRTSKQSSIDWDTSLVFVSRSLGLSRLPVTAEGIDDPELFAQSQWYDRGEASTGIHLLSQTTGKKHLQLLLLLGSYYAFQSDSYLRYKDSVEYFLNRAINESKTINEKALGRVALCLLGKMYVEGADTAKSNIIFNRLIDECKREDDKKAEAKALAYWAIYTPPSPVNAQEKIGRIQKATEIYQALGDRESEIPLLVQIGYLYIRMARFDDAYNSFMKALQLENSIGYPYTHYTTYAISIILTVQDKFAEPLRYALESTKIADATRDSVGWANFYTQLGNLYITEGGREEEAMKWMMKAVERFARINDANMYLTLFTIVSSLGEAGRAQEGFELITRLSKKVQPQYPLTWIYYNMSFAEAYRGVKQYKLAEHYAATADSILKLPIIPSVLKSYLGLNVNYLFGSVKFDNHQFGQAKKYFDQYLSTPSRAPLLKTEMSVYQRLIQIDSILHDAPSGVKHYRQYTQLLDSNFRVSKIRQAEELQVMYQTQEKESQIALLNQQAKVEQANLKQATLEKNVTIAGIIGALIIAGLLYWQNKIRQKNNIAITHKNQQLERLLTEKEWLLKEIHHRVKNNLQIVMSLLNSQSAYIDNEPALTAIHESQNRVHAMSLIHQKLYGSENVSTIDMSVYIRELVSYLADSFDTEQRIRFEYNIEPIEMDVGQAVPLGLILNEAITNSIKYAFPVGRFGVISISLSHTPPHHCLLIISDNGVGIPPQFKNKKLGSLGMSLIHGLSEDIDGNLSIENSNGTTIKISFVNESSIKRADSVAASYASDN